jgi:hypothetical protein
MSTGDKRARDQDPSGTEPPASMPRIETDPVEAAIQKAIEAYPVGPERLKAIRESSCKLPPLQTARMIGGTVELVPGGGWITASEAVEEGVAWGPSAEFSGSPGATHGMKLKMKMGKEFVKWFMALWWSAVDCFVANDGGPNMPKKAKAKLQAAKSQDDKRTIVTEVLKLHCPLNADGILTVKFKLIAEGEPKPGDADAVQAFPDLTRDEYNKGGFQVVARPWVALDGKTQIPAHKVIQPVQGRPCFVGQVRGEFQFKASLTPGGTRVCVLATACNFQLISMKAPDGGAQETMPSLEGI